MKRPASPSWGRLPRAAGEPREYGMASLHLHNRQLEMSINKDVLQKLGWKKGDQLVYVIAGDGLKVKRFDPNNA